MSPAPSFLPPSLPPSCPPSFPLPPPPPPPAGAAATHSPSRPSRPTQRRELPAAGGEERGGSGSCPSHAFSGCLREPRVREPASRAAPPEGLGSRLGSAGSDAAQLGLRGGLLTPPGRECFAWPELPERRGKTNSLSEKTNRASSHPAGRPIGALPSASRETRRKTQ